MEAVIITKIFSYSLWVSTYLKMQSYVPMNATADIQASETKVKGLSWNEEENIYLARASTNIFNDPMAWSQQTKSTLPRIFLAELIRDSSRPVSAFISDRYDGDLDFSRLNGRPTKACIKNWLDMRVECTQSWTCRKRVLSMDLTRKPKSEQIDRCAMLESSHPQCIIWKFYDCINDPDYSIRKTIKYTAVFH